jgi:hypothetical protein
VIAGVERSVFDWWCERTVVLRALSLPIVAVLGALALLEAVVMLPWRLSRD